MGKINISPNLFLEVAELNRMMYFIKEAGYKRVLNNLIKSFGVSLKDPNSFRVYKKEGNIVTVNPGVAIDENLEIIHLSSPVDINVKNSTDTRRWLVISRDTHHFEEGYVNVSTDGTITGVDTKFTEVLRGHVNFPTKVRFPESKLNDSEYQVVQVTDDNSALISGALVDETQIRYSVIGAFSAGFIPTKENREIYEYDGCKFRMIDSDEVPRLNSGEYFIASFVFDNSGSIYVADERGRNEFGTDGRISGISASSSEFNESLITLNSVKLFSSSVVGDKVNSVISLSFTLGCEIVSYELSSNSSGNYIKILNLKRPDGTRSEKFTKRDFLGHKIVDLNTMKETTITNVDGVDIYMNSVDLSMFNDKSKLVILPPYQIVEFLTTFGEERVGTRFHVDNFKARLLVPITFDATENGYIDIVVKKRLYNSSSTLLKGYENLPVVNYDNIRGNVELLAGSSFRVTHTDLRIVEKQRNYS